MIEVPESNMTIRTTIGDGNTCITHVDNVVIIYDATGLGFEPGDQVPLELDLPVIAEIRITGEKGAMILIQNVLDALHNYLNG